MAKRDGGALLTAANFSLGVNIFEQVAAHAARLLAHAPGFEAQLVETHHSAKKDAPSGTAATLEQGGVEGVGRADSDHEHSRRIGAGDARVRVRRAVRADSSRAHRARPARVRGGRARRGRLADRQARRVHDARRAVSIIYRANDHDRAATGRDAERRSSRRSMRSGSIDEAALRALVDWQIEEGIHFLVPCGSTGEAATMTLDEHDAS